jgi:hypothetical protein
MVHRLWLAALILGLAGCDPPAVGDNACFSKHVLPLVKDDCATCHSNGEYFVRLQGVSGDYPEVLRYVVPFRGEASPFLRWAAGLEDHPVVWWPGTVEYENVAAWIRGGAGPNCFDHTLYGECRQAADCVPVPCACPGQIEGDLLAGCRRDDFTGRGRCARRDDCAEVAALLCPDSDAGAGDGGVDGSGGPEAVSFTADIVPLLRRDCTPCHSYGRYGVALDGIPADFSEVMRYTDTADPEGSGSFLWWAAGGQAHPISWSTDSAEYQLFLTWVEQGALNN